MQEFRSFVATGDSFTEGVGDPRSDGSSCRGWADRFAEHLAASTPGFRYANLAIRGRLLGEVLDEQIPAAIRLRPDLVSVAAGGNDLLRPSTDPDDVAATYENAVATLTAAGATVLVFTGFDPKTFPVLRLIRGKSAILTVAVRDIAQRYGCLVADVWAMRILADRRLWTPDRLHLTPEGHRRVALLACEAVGAPVSDDWRAPLATAPAPTGPMGAAATWLTARRSDAIWVTEHVAPYLSRRLHGVSSGDGVLPKRPLLAPVLPVPAVQPAPGPAVPAASAGPPGSPGPPGLGVRSAAVPLAGASTKTST
ncbi:MAG TPA: SGNH/GDSL hydrolase family protein [Streptosporangiaceae bacterium]